VKTNKHPASNIFLRYHVDKVSILQNFGFLQTIHGDHIQLLPSDLLITQMEATYPLKSSLKIPKKVTGKNLDHGNGVYKKCPMIYPW